MSKNDGIDQSWGYADPAAAAKAGIRAVSMYLSRDESKNVTAAKVKAYHAHGIGVLLNWEDEAGAPLQGAAKGRGDAAAAVLQARGLHAPAGVCIYFSCDTDINPLQYKAINAYYRAAGKVVHAAGYKLGCYGEADLVAHLAAAGITDAEWQTLAWSGGRLDPAADFYQTGINGHLGGAAVDYDRIIHPAQLGAWWPTNSPYVQEDDMAGIGISKYFRGADKKPHQVRTLVQQELAPVLKLLADVDKRLAALQAAQAKPGTVTVTPTDVPATLHIGDHQ